MKYKFNYFEFDVSNELPKQWDKDILEYVYANAGTVKIVPTDSITSRESLDVTEVPTLVIDGKEIRENFPWLYDLYEDVFLEYAKESFESDNIFTSEEDLYALNFNIQKGSNMRYECHVDSNPIQGVLYVTTHQKGSGGELVISENSKSIGVEEIDMDAIEIYPKKGSLYLFPGCHYPHYVRPLNEENGIRVSITMNFYTEENPEKNRPKDLNMHLFDKEK